MLAHLLYSVNNRRLYKSYLSHRICYVQQLHFIENYIDEKITLTITSRFVNEVGINCCWNQVDFLLPLLSIQFVVRSWYPNKSTTALPANECSIEFNFPHKCCRSCLVVAHLVLTRSPYPHIGETYFYTGLLIWSSTRVSVYGICRALSNDKPATAAATQKQLSHPQSSSKRSEERDVFDLGDKNTGATFSKNCPANSLRNRQNFAQECFCFCGEVVND